jgi:hypothetical protein
MSRPGRRPSEGASATGRPGYGSEAARSDVRSGVPQGTPLRRDSRPETGVRDADFAPLEGSDQRSSAAEASASSRPGPAAGSRDNSSRFDD